MTLPRRAAALALAAVVGAGCSLPGASLPPEPTEGPSPSASPTPTPGPTASPTPGTQTGTGSVALGNGIKAAIPSGWKLLRQDAENGYAELTNGQSVIAVQQIKVKTGTTGQQLVDAYMKGLASKLTGAKIQPAKTIDVGTTKVSVGLGAMTATRSTSQGSVTLGYLPLISVRVADGQAAMATLIFDAKEGPDAHEKGFVTVANSLIESQVNG